MYKYFGILTASPAVASPQYYLINDKPTSGTSGQKVDAKTGYKTAKTTTREENPRRKGANIQMVSGFLNNEFQPTFYQIGSWLCCKMGVPCMVVLRYLIGAR
jgi:hypothetical protein